MAALPPEAEGKCQSWPLYALSDKVCLTVHIDVIDLILFPLPRTPYRTSEPDRTHLAFGHLDIITRFSMCYAMMSIWVVKPLEMR